MADIGISYAHADALMAIGVRRAFVERGFSVWMDEVGEVSDTVESIGLPVGQAHWDVITAEFAAANLLIVVNTANWRNSRYCQDEYAFVRDWGKWVEFIDVDRGLDEARIDEIAAVFTARQTVSSAHARLVEAARATTTHEPSRLERLLHRGDERDAQMVFASSPGVDGVTVTERLAPYARAAIELGRQARRRLRRIAISVTVVLTVLALAGVGALLFARSGERSARQSAARSQALELAAQSTAEVDTVKALAQAREAAQLAPGRDTTEALNFSTANDKRLRTLVIDPEDFMAATWAAGAPKIVAYTSKRLVVLDADTGKQLGSIDFDDPVRLGSVAVSTDGGLAVFATSKEQRLGVVDLNSGDMRTTDVQNVDTVGTGDGEELWWTVGNTLNRGNFATVGKSAPQQYPLPQQVLAIDITADRQLLDYVDTRGVVHTTAYDSTSVTETGSFPVVPQDAGPETPSPINQMISNPSAVIAPSYAFGASLKRCGNDLFGGIEGETALKGTTFSVNDGTVQAERQHGAPRVPVCNTNGTAWYTTVMPGGPSQNYGTGFPWLPRGAERILPVADPSNSRVAAITNNGRLYHVRPNQIERDDADGSLAMLRIGTTDYVVRADGRVTPAESEIELGRIPEPFDADTATTVNSYAAVATQDMLWRIDETGRSSELLSLKNTAVYSIRGGSDGKTMAGAMPNAILLIDPATGKNAVIDIDGLQPDETPVDADISPSGDAASFVTDAGRVGTITLSGFKSIAAPQFYSESLAPGTRSRLAYLPDSGQLIVATSDGAVRRFDADLKVTDIAFFGGAVDRLSTTDDLAVLSSNVLGTAIYDGPSLTALDRLPPDIAPLTPDSVTLDRDRKRLTGLIVSDSRTGEGSVRQSIPLPTL